MMATKLILTIVAFVVCTSRSFTQSSPDTLGDRLDDAIETALEDVTRDVEESQYAEQLMQLSVQPFDLNIASAADLSQIPGVNPLIARRIITYRRDRAFRSVEELLLIEGVNGTLFQQIRDFLVVGPSDRKREESQRFSMRYTQRTIVRLNQQQGFLDGSYTGNPYKIYNRLLVQYPISPGLQVRAGGLMEKDPGERRLDDFTSGFLELSDSQESVLVILGDYVMEAGQGLALWRSSGTMKGTEVIAGIEKWPRGLRPYTSSDENGFLRGGAVQARWSGVDAAVFVSRKAINATVNEQGLITSFEISGLSRTQTELQKKSSSAERTLGLNINFMIAEDLRGGVRGYTTQFDNPVEISTTNGFRGQQASVTSADISYTSGTVASFGEMAVDRARSVASIVGVVFEPSAVVDVAFILRSYPQHFVSLRGFGFGESGGQPQNEKGIYASTRCALFSWLNVSGYFDQFSTFGPGTISPFPVYGQEVLGVLRLEPDGRTTFQCQIKQKTQTIKEFVEDPLARSVAVLGSRTQTNYRTSFEWIPSPRIRWKTRFEYVGVHYRLAGGSAKGILVYQDVRIRPRSKLNFDGRMVFFDTDSYDSRVYEYESELRGTFVNPALYGRGVRMYVLGRCEIGVFELSVKYAITLKPGARALGTGDGEIRGDSDSQISFQCDITV